LFATGLISDGIAGVTAVAVHRQPILTDLVTEGERRVFSPVPLTVSTILTDLITDGERRVLCPVPLTVSTILTDLITDGERRVLSPVPPTVSRYLPTSSLMENVEYSAQYH